MTTVDYMMAAFKAKRPHSFYRLLPTLQFHFLQGETDMRGKVKACEEAAIKADNCSGRLDDDAIRNQRLDEWVARIGAQLSLFVNSDKNFILVAAGRMEDAFGAVYCGLPCLDLALMFNPALAAGVHPCDDNLSELDYEAACAKYEGKLEPVHVAVAICPEFRELQRQREQRNQQKKGTCELFYEVFTKQQFDELRDFLQTVHAVDASTAEDKKQERKGEAAVPGKPLTEAILLAY